MNTKNFTKLTKKHLDKLLTQQYHIANLFLHKLLFLSVLCVSKISI